MRPETLSSARPAARSRCAASPPQSTTTRVSPASTASMVVVRLASESAAPVPSRCKIAKTPPGCWRDDTGTAAASNGVRHSTGTPPARRHFSFAAGGGRCRAPRRGPRSAVGDEHVDLAASEAHEVLPERPVLVGAHGCVESRLIGEAHLRHQVVSRLAAESVGGHAVEGHLRDPWELANQWQVHLLVVLPEGVLVVRPAVERDELDHVFLHLTRSFSRFSSSFTVGRITCTVAPTPMRSPSSLTARQSTWTRLRSWRLNTPWMSTRMPGRAEARWSTSTR